jgi:hypothetical protein
LAVDHLQAASGDPNQASLAVCPVSLLVQLPLLNPVKLLFAQPIVTLAVGGSLLVVVLPVGCTLLAVMAPVAAGHKVGHYGEGNRSQS